MPSAIEPAVRGSTRRPATRVDFLDHLRGCAILGVMVLHSVGAAYPPEVWVSGPYWVRPAILGAAGVPMFFVVSGFCIHTSHVVSGEEGLAPFFRRRFFRIYPPYLLALLAFSVGRSPSLPQMVSHLGLFHNFSPHWFFGINGSFWSIAVEFQLYCLYPLLHFAARRWSWRHVLVLAGLSEGIIGLVPEVPFWLYRSVFAFVFSWSIGAALADAYLRGRQPLPFSAAWHRLVWPLPLLMPMLLGPDHAVLTFTFAALSTAAWISWALKRDWARVIATLPMRVLATIGLCSYSLYLFHQPFLLAFIPNVPSPELKLAWCLLLIVPLICLGYSLYRVVEIPSSRLGRRGGLTFLRGLVWRPRVSSP